MSASIMDHARRYGTDQAWREQRIKARRRRRVLIEAARLGLAALIGGGLTWALALLIIRGLG